MTSAATALSPDRLGVAENVIALLAGPDARLRDDQLRAVSALLEPGAKVLVVQATGWGKSAVYWAATAIRRADAAGLTLVVSPLLSLMGDQVAAAQRAGLSAATINSGNLEDWGRIEARMAADDLDVLLVSPERLANPGFGRRVLERLRGRLGLLVVDEAHSISDWGHDFRPDYRRVADTLMQLDPTCPVLATTATANARVTQDVAQQLGQATTVLRGPLGRDSLQLAVLPQLSALQRYAWVVDHVPLLPGSGIVYTLTVADAERLAEAITAAHGPIAAAYTGRLDPAERARLEEALRRNEVKVLVATSALGMGFDKPDLGFVVHVGSPPSPVSYYQQIGRAGRGIDRALVALLPSASDDGVWRYFATATLPDPQQIATMLTVLDGDPSSVPSIEAATGIRRGRVELQLKQLAVENVVERVEGGWIATGKQWHYDGEHVAQILAQREGEAAIMRDYLAGRECLMTLLRRSLDDPDAPPCGRCSVCLGALPAPLRPEPSRETVAGVSQLLRRGFHELEPRKMWPGGVFGRKGRIPASQAAQVGRVLVHADAPEWEEALTLLRQDRLDPQLRNHAVGVLAQWKEQWVARPQMVLDLDAEGHPRALGALADHLAEVGKLERASVLLTDAPGPAEQGGGAEALGWATRCTLPAGLALNGRCVLLVVDATATGWVVTVAASMLRSAGASHVLPLLIHRRV